MIHRAFTSVVILAVVLGLACVDMSAPKGPASISNLKLPSPSVVVGDVMRDSTGAPAPLTIVAFNSAGVPTTAANAEFFITDSTKAAHLNGGTLLAGDKIGATIIIGQLGNLQTSSVTIPVTYLPFKMVHAGTDSALTAAATSDTSVNTFANLMLTVTSAEDSGSAGIVVQYALLHAPPSVTNAAHPAVFIADNSGHIATTDTTQATGTSTRRLMVFPALLAEEAALLGGTTTDSAIVEARASYKGALLNGAPVRFVIPIRVALK
ncbi:MAG: hypothetical protein ACREPM_14435 [Gemmatimonadaceae bacterium]